MSGNRTVNLNTNATKLIFSAGRCSTLRVRRVGEEIQVRAFNGQLGKPTDESERLYALREKRQVGPVDATRFSIPSGQFEQVTKGQCFRMEPRGSGWLALVSCSPEELRNVPAGKPQNAGASVSDR